LQTGISEPETGEYILVGRRDIELQVDPFNPVVLKLWGATPKGGAAYFITDKN
jgi:hypothetical protein